MCKKGTHHSSFYEAILECLLCSVSCVFSLLLWQFVLNANANKVNQSECVSGKGRERDLCHWKGRQELTTEASHKQTSEQAPSALQYRLSESLLAVDCQLTATHENNHQRTMKISLLVIVTVLVGSLWALEVVSLSLPSSAFGEYVPRLATRVSLIT